MEGGVGLSHTTSVARKSSHRSTTSHQECAETVAPHALEHHPSRTETICLVLRHPYGDTPCVEDDHDRLLRQSAIDHARRLALHADDIVRLDVLRAGFDFGGRRISFGSFMSGIYRPKELHGPAALAIVTVAPKNGKPAPYEDTYDETAGTFAYRFRDAKTDTPAARVHAERDNRTLIEAFERGLPLIYFRGITPGQYMPIAPVFITNIDQAARTASLEVGLPAEVSADSGGIGAHDARRYATRETAYRLHQQHFRRNVLAAYRVRCAVCSLKEAPLLQAAHIIGDSEKMGDATVVNGVSLCAIHHLAYDRNLMGIDPRGVVHLNDRLLHEIDGPMLKNGLQAFHGAHILQPRSVAERPDPERLEVRFAEFRAAA